MSEKNSSSESNTENSGSNYFNSQEMKEIFESLFQRAEPILSEIETDKISKAWSQVKRKKLFNIID